MIYFIQSGRSRFVKIGYCAGDPNTRLAQLQCGNPETLTLLAVKSGGKDAESYWHSRFSHLRVRGEWFEWCDEIREYAQPLLADPEQQRKDRAQVARDIIAGRAPSRGAYERLFSARPWSQERRQRFVDRKFERCPEIEAEIERLRV